MQCVLCLIKILIRPLLLITHFDRMENHLLNVDRFHQTHQSLAKDTTDDIVSSFDSMKARGDHLC